MGKIPTIAIIAIVVVLVIGISVASFYFLIKPKQEELAGLKEKLAAEEAVVAQLPDAQRQAAEVKASWDRAQAELAAVRQRKSIPISLYMPLVAMTAIWYEYREELPAVVSNYLTSQGVTIEQGAAMPAPPLAPPTVPSNGFMQVPGQGQALNLTVSGTLGAIQKVYTNLAQLPRIATIGSLSLSGTGDRLTATFPLSLWIIVEGAEAVSPPPAAAAGGGEGPGAGPGPGSGPEGMEGKSGGDGAPKDDGAAKDDGGSKGGDDGGGGGGGSSDE